MEVQWHNSCGCMQDRFAIQHPVCLFLNCASIINSPVTKLNKNTLGVKKCEANQKQHARRQAQPKALISAEAKKLATLSKNF